MKLLAEIIVHTVMLLVLVSVVLFVIILIGTLFGFK